MSSQSQQILLTADEMSPLAEPEFLFVRKVVAVDTPHLYTLRVKVDIALPVTFRLGYTFLTSCQQQIPLRENHLDGGYTVVFSTNTLKAAFCLVTQVSSVVFVL